MVQDDNPVCPKCAGQMENGFLLDVSTGYGQSTWVEGQPEHTRFSMIKIKGKRMYQTITFRCVNCGFLESYSPRASNTLVRPAGPADIESETHLLHATSPRSDLPEIPT